MKYLLIFITLTGGSIEPCHAPFPLLKHSDELFDTQAECENAFRNSEFYKSEGQLIGFCMAVSPLYLSPKQLSNKIEPPSCH